MEMQTSSMARRLLADSCARATSSQTAESVRNSNKSLMRGAIGVLVGLRHVIKMPEKIEREFSNFFYSCLLCDFKCGNYVLKQRKEKILFNSTFASGLMKSTQIYLYLFSIIFTNST
jgi:hypothetical protein